MTKPVAVAIADESDDWIVVTDPGEWQDGPIIPAAATSMPVEEAEEPEYCFLGYLHLQFCIREKEGAEAPPLLCVLNMQLSHHTTGKGLGKFALQLLELLARRNSMELVMLWLQDGEIKTMSLTKSKPVEAVRGVFDGVHESQLDDDHDFEIICPQPHAFLSGPLPLTSVQ